MNAANALARTMLLMRRNLRPEVSDDELLDALTSVRVVLVADDENLAAPEGQYALVTAALLIARSGAKCLLHAPNARLSGVHTPLEQTHLVDALLEVGVDLVPGQEILAGYPAAEADLSIVLGDSPFRGSASRITRLSGDAWEGQLGFHGRRWISRGAPFGALAAAGLAAGEVYKVAMRRLRHFAAPGPFDDFFRATEFARVALAPAGTPPPTVDIGRFDMVSGGAITHAALYALARIPGVRGRARVIEADANEITNINRYALLLRKALGLRKAEHIAGLGLGSLQIESVPLRYEPAHRKEIGSLAPRVLVGVDNIESRWSVQDEHPRWLGIGATEEYFAFLSVHEPGLPCARCVHESGPPPEGEIPTVAFVSHWAGLVLAAALARELSGVGHRADEQLNHFQCLQLGSPAGIWKMRGNGRLGCSCTRGRAVA